jgi:DNA primase
MLLELAREIGLQPKRTSATQGGEYHSTCPDPCCGGKDRFILWPEKARYWCRQCKKSGDPIQFCRDFMGLTYFQACEKTDKRLNEYSFYPPIYTKPIFAPKQTVIPSRKWQSQASDFVTKSHQCALKSSEAMNQLKNRGFTLDTIKKFQLGWNDFNRRDASNLWGINEKNAKDVWLPPGIVIPAFFEERVMKLKIRRSAIPQGDDRKYVIVTGGRNSPSFFGQIPHRPIIILESELDSILVHQFAEDLCACIAIPAGNMPDAWGNQILRAAPKLIFSMDFDEAGKKTFPFWKSLYPQIKTWPVPRGKSPGNAYELGVNLREWVIAGVI